MKKTVRDRKLLWARHCVGEYSLPQPWDKYSLFPIFRIHLFVGVTESVSWQSWNSSPGVCLWSLLSFCFTKTKDSKKVTCESGTKPCPRKKRSFVCHTWHLWVQRLWLSSPPVSVSLTVRSLDGVVSTQTAMGFTSQATCPHLAFTGCVSFGKLYNLPGPHCPCQ